MCCRYIALPIETPEDWGDYDDIRWYLSHENITVFVEDGDWYLNVNNKCKYLSEKDYKCQNYDMRPKICRGYTTETCDLTSDSTDDYDYEMHFTSDTQMEEYIKIKFGPKIFDKLEKKKKVKKTKKKKKAKR
jgi:Fe-S-cluster containining protein